MGSISLVGDFNGDGFGDFIVGLMNDFNFGKNGVVYVVFGGCNFGFSGFFNFSNLNGGNGFII